MQDTIWTLCGQDKDKLSAVQKWMSRTYPDIPRTKDAPLSDSVRDIVLSAPALKSAGFVRVQTDIAPKKVPVVLEKKKADPIQSNQKKRWMLWACLAMAVSATTPNMFWVITQVKGSVAISAITTIVFTIAPFFLVAYGVKGWAKAAVYSVILIEVFCNTSSFYGGLTGLAHGVFIDPTTFLNMAATMVNSSYEGTALFLSLSMAFGIAALAVIPVYELGKGK